MPNGDSSYISTFVIDSSALNLLLSDEKSSEALVKSNLAFLITKDTYAEIHGGSKPDYIHARMKRLFNLDKNSTKFQKFFYTGTIADWINLEHRNNGVIDQFQVLTKKEHTEHLDLIADKIRYKKFHTEKLKPKIDLFYQQKLELEQNDISTRLNESARLSDSEIILFIRNFKGIQYLDEMPDQFIKITKSLIAPKYQNIPLHDLSENYFYFKTLTNLMLLRHLGNLIRSFDKTPDLTFLKELKRGNWTDLAGIAMGSREFGLITEDKDQYSMYQFLKSRKLLKNEVFKLADFLNLP